MAGRSPENLMRLNRLMPTAQGPDRMSTDIGDEAVTSGASIRANGDPNPAQIEVGPCPEADSVQADGGGAPETAGRGIRIVADREPRQFKAGVQKRKAAFLEAFRGNGSVTESALIAGTDQATHCDWLSTDAMYKAAFEAAGPVAAGASEDHLIRMAVVGLFKPIVYKGKLQYAERRRTMCKLADGTTAFEDELPTGASVIERRTVTTGDGEQLGVYRPNVNLLIKLLAAWMPEKYCTNPKLMPERYSAAVRLTGAPRGSGAIAETEPRRFRTRTEKRQRAFLTAFQNNCSVTESALLAGIDRAAHYGWLATDTNYKAAFEKSRTIAAGVLEDHLIRLALIGFFEPVIYKGRFQYAKRRRTMCKLADGTTAFEDELPAGARVIERRAVMTRDGEQLGVYKKNALALIKVAAARRPEKYGTNPRLRPERYSAALQTRTYGAVPSAAEAMREILRGVGREELLPQEPGESQADSLARTLGISSRELKDLLQSRACQSSDEPGVY